MLDVRSKQAGYLASAKDQLIERHGAHDIPCHHGRQRPGGQFIAGVDGGNNRLRCGDIDERSAGPRQRGRADRLQRSECRKNTLDWGKVRAYFVGGVLISNNQNSFSSSSANQFLDLNVDKFWHVPYCAIDLTSKGVCSNASFVRRLGFSTYFETRLTAIPMSATTTTTTSATTGGVTSPSNH